MDLKLTGHTLEEVTFGYTVTIRFSGGFYLSFGTPFSVHGNSSTVEFTPDADEPTEIGILKNLAGHFVESAIASDEGRLMVGFTSGEVLEADSDEDYEAWFVAGPDGFKVVCMPSGELAIWDDNKE